MSQQRFLMLRLFTCGLVVKAKTYDQAIRQASKIPGEHWILLPKDMQGIDSPHMNLIDPEQPHVLVLYDLEYYQEERVLAQLPGNTSHETIQEAYIPSKLIAAFQSLQKAFQCFTQVDPIHIIQYDDETFYTHDGQPREETEKDPHSLMDLAVYFYC